METHKSMAEVPEAPLPAMLLQEATAFRSARPLIDAECRRFVCLYCRTKTLWPHKIGCVNAAITKPECTDCRYWSARKLRCDHPAVRKERAAK